MLKDLDNSNISKHLGQTSQYKSTYDPSLLVRMFGMLMSFHVYALMVHLFRV